MRSVAGAASWCCALGKGRPPSSAPTFDCCSSSTACAHAPSRSSKSFASSSRHPTRQRRGNSRPGPGLAPHPSSNRPLPDHSAPQAPRIASSSFDEVVALGEHRPATGRTEALNNNWETLIRRGHDYGNHAYVLLKLAFVTANPLRTGDGMKRLQALGLPTPHAKEAA